ncbi:MAG TPA: hypothetical protein VM820_07115 [Vicinamibacterales bacterium]|nr:hypothetical protein [Vicinamibacterales bacterium]
MTHSPESKRIARQIQDRYKIPYTAAKAIAEAFLASDLDDVHHAHNVAAWVHATGGAVSWDVAVRLLAQPQAAPEGGTQTDAVMHRDVDRHVWKFRIDDRRDARGTARIQTFRDQVHRGWALITIRPGDRGPSYVNGAEVFRERAWREFFAADADAPTLVFNLLDPLQVIPGWEITTVSFDRDGILSHPLPAPRDLVRRLTEAGAEWDAGTEPQTPKPTSVRAVRVFRLVPLPEMPVPQRLFREMGAYQSVNWSAAVEVAVGALQNGAPIPDNVGSDVALAAASLWEDPIVLSDDRPADFVNGQHRAQAMRDQGVKALIIEDRRLADDPPLAGELTVIVERP